MIALFSLWGRFALRNRLAKSVIVDCNAELSSYLCNNTIEIIDYEQLNDRSWLLVYKDKEDHVVENDTSNPILALWLVILCVMRRILGLGPPLPHGFTC